MSDDQSVLVVEDDALLRELTTLTLEDAGYAVVGAHTGSAALEVLDGSADPFCAVVTDVNLGAGPDGWAVARRARELDHDLPIIYVTGASGHRWRVDGVPRSLLLTKPCSASQLVGAVSSLLNNRR
jgi:DNA-binding response OmpR family regulator